MQLEKLMRFKGITFGTLGLVLAFLLYLALNYGLQKTAQKDLKYASAAIALADQVSSDIDASEAQRIIAKLEAFKTGQSVRVAGETINTYTLAGFLSPETSNLDDVVAQLKSQDLDAASSAAASLAKNVERRVAKKLKLTNYLQVAAAIIAVVLYLLAIIPMILRLSESEDTEIKAVDETKGCLLYTSPSPRDKRQSRMPSSA